MMEKKKKLPKAVKIIGIILLALAVAWGGFTIVSHAVYHRSNMATIVEIYFRVFGKLCDKTVQKTNAEVIYPIYPLAPNHTWEETYDLWHS